MTATDKSLCDAAARRERTEPTKRALLLETAKAFQHAAKLVGGDERVVLAVHELSRADFDALAPDYAMEVLSHEDGSPFWCGWLHVDRARFVKIDLFTSEPPAKCDRAAAEGQAACDAVTP